MILLNSFMFVTLQNQLVTDHILRLLVKWQEGGLSLSVSEHNQYLDELSKQLSSQLRGIIDEIIEEDKTKVHINQVIKNKLVVVQVVSLVV